MKRCAVRLSDEQAAHSLSPGREALRGTGSSDGCGAMEPGLGGWMACLPVGAMASVDRG